LQTQQRSWNVFRHGHVVRFVVKASLVAVVGLLAVGSTVETESARGSSYHGERLVGRCIGSGSSSPIVRGERASMGARYGRATRNEEAYPRAEEPACSAVGSARVVNHGPKKMRQPIRKGGRTRIHKPLRKHKGRAVGYRNVFPYGQCTWWANQRYRQLHGYYVPWVTNANAWQWTARAREFGWRVSRRPVRGAIVDLQPWVQGAYGMGHVGVVERVLGDGRVVVSTMNWGRRRRWEVTRWTFAPGPGVTFISL